MNVTAIVHVYYPELWPELAVCIRNLGPDVRLIVTYGIGNDKAVEAARRDFPRADFVACENRGYDIWPFLMALRRVDFATCDLIVKLHTKRDIDLPRKAEVGYTVLNGSRWRDLLLAFVRTQEAWARTLRRFAEDPAVGLVANRSLVFKRRDARKGNHADSFDRAIAELETKWGLRAKRSGRFVGGTMFAVRAALFKPLADYPFTPELFEASGGHETETYAHVMERLFGLIVSAQGARVEGFDGSVAWRRFWATLGKFFFDSRRTERRRSVRICGITVYLKRLRDD